MFKAPLIGLHVEGKHKVFNVGDVVVNRYEDGEKYKSRILSVRVYMSGKYLMTDYVLALPEN